MKGIRFSSFLPFLLLTCGTAVGASFLQPTKFPTVADDYSFTERMESLAEDYGNYAGLSAYDYLVLQDAEAATQAAIDAQLKAEGLDKCDGCDENGNPPPQDGSTYYAVVQPVTSDASVGAPGVAPVVGGGTVVVPGSGNSGNIAPGIVNTGAQMRQGGGYCSLRHPKIPQGQRVPLGLPVNMGDMPNQSAFKNSKTKSIISNTLKGLMASPYGCERGRPHTGVDIGCTADFYRQPVYATADGVVESIQTAGGNRSAGNYIRIKHGNGWVTQYMHLDQMVVSKGQQVSAGCLIGYMGYTGGNKDQKVRSMGIGLTHLHYEILYSGSASSVTTPSGKKIPIVRKSPCNGSFKDKIRPNELMIYYGG
ncbi:MAG: M23 family metallopeptidase [Alphaproteobacteria bacterium]|nr:M23 family metallopeptidase [Alphaproteobacteria bacterium]